MIMARREKVKYMTVTYNNDFNNVINKEVGITDLNLMYGLIGLIKNTDGNKLELDYDYVNALAGRNPDEKPNRTFDFINKFMTKIDRTVKVTESDHRGPYRLVGFPLFNLTDNNKVDGKLILAINDAFDVRTIIKELDSSFTRLDFNTYLNLNSKYSKGLYRLIMQFSSTGTYRVNVEKLRLLLCVPDSIDNKKLMQTIIKPAIEEINKESSVISNLTVNKKTNNNREIDTLTFFFDSDFSNKEMLPPKNDLMGKIKAISDDEFEKLRQSY